MRLNLTTAAATAALLGLAAMSTPASAKVFVLTDTIGDHTDILNTSDELTGGDAKVSASKGGKPFSDSALFVVKPGDLLTSFSITTQETNSTGEISGGTAEIFKENNKGKYVEVLTTLTNIAPASEPGATSYSSEFTLGPGNYEIVIKSSGVDLKNTQGVAKYSVDLIGSAVPEPATWAMMILGVGMIGFAARRRRDAGALALALA